MSLTMAVKIFRMTLTRVANFWIVARIKFFSTLVNRCDSTNYSPWSIGIRLTESVPKEYKEASPLNHLASKEFNTIPTL